MIMLDNVINKNKREKRLIMHSVVVLGKKKPFL